MYIGIAPISQLRTYVMKIVHIQGRSPNVVSDFPYHKELLLNWLPLGTNSFLLPIERQEKKHLKMLSAEVVCCKQLHNITDELSIEANSVDPEQTAPMGTV